MSKKHKSVGAGAFEVRLAMLNFKKLIANQMTEKRTHFYEE